MLVNTAGLWIWRVLDRAGQTLSGRTDTHGPAGRLFRPGYSGNTANSAEGVTCLMELSSKRLSFGTCGVLAIRIRSLGQHDGYESDLMAAALNASHDDMVAAAAYFFEVSCRAKIRQM